MLRKLSLAALLTAGLAVPAFAGDDKAAAVTQDVTGYTAELNAAAAEKQARNLLIARGYTQISDLTRDESGRWLGVALKDGRVQGVAVAMPPKPATLTN